MQVSACGSVLRRQMHMHCTACSARAEGSDEPKTCDEMMFQVDSVQQQIRAAPTDADLTIDGKQFRLCVWVCARVLLLAGSACHADDCMMIACCADSM